MKPPSARRHPGHTRTIGRALGALVVWMAIGGCAHAGTQDQVCDERALAAIRQIWQLPADAEFIDIACKPWPDDPTRLLTLAVTGGEDGPPGVDVARLRLALIDRAQGRAVARFDELIGEDATFRLRPDVFILDTARYRLAPGVRAFGVVTRLSLQASCPSGGIDDSWRLFVAEGAGIRPISDGELYLRSWRYRPSRECIAEPDHETTLRLDVRPRPGQWADLVIRAQRDDRRAPLVLTVPYDGQAYRLQPALARLLEFDNLGARR